MCSGGLRSFHGHCFACGAHNGDGMHMHIRATDVGAMASFTPPSKYEGYSGVLHGGIVATALDAAMVHAVRKIHGGEPLTSRLEIRYRAIAPVGFPVEIYAVVDRRRGNICWAHADLRVNGQLCSSAVGTFTIRSG